MKPWGVGGGVHLHGLLRSALSEGELSASCPGRFTPGEIAAVLIQ